ncbi:putative procollagen-lysine 5-dioxygenase [Lupinus albus]|uniref:Putative procollagen-lysine 5-dioxygenase n=1 Tax=Lupinus albus TaxID=3870 RepID=A0A6A4Q1G4_LUPAL|nr:putative procollagen-lysine 5-dioxygenase [Lupinus albus]
MSFLRSSSDRRKSASKATRSAVHGGGKSKIVVNQRLQLNPDKNHQPESYEDLKSNHFGPWIFQELEKHLPSNMLDVSREKKVKYMRGILNEYLSPAESFRSQKQKEFRQKIISNYPPLYKELYTMDPTAFFVPDFLRAINDNTEESFRRIMSEPAPGIFAFEMLQPRFCELLMSEFDNFERWVHDQKVRVMRPNTMNQYGAVLDDFGFQTMLAKLMEDFICPLSEVFYAEIGGANLDSHHGFIVEYGNNRDVDLGLHVDDAEVTLNVCLGTQFSGGDLFFRGMRCEKHVNTESRPEEVFDYSHFPGQAVLHHGRHRHGARATISGHRVNLLLWCRSSVYREIRKYQKGFCSWCGECKREKEERMHLLINNTKLDLSMREGEPTV